jgi:hypothetical protein
MMGMRHMEAGAVKVIKLMWTDPRVWNGMMVFAFLSFFLSDHMTVRNLCAINWVKKKNQRD